MLGTDTGAPARDAGATDVFRILGRTSAPAGEGTIGVDPVGDWKPDAGLLLSATTPDATGRPRFSGHASFPQGASVAYKAIVEAAGLPVRYEREGAGNRLLIVPIAPTAAIALDWQN